MAKKIDAALAERLSALGIKAKNEDEAREKLLKILADNDIDGMEEEDTDSLLDMAESMVDSSDDDSDDEEKENDALADEDEDDEDEDDEEDSDSDEDSDEEDKDDEEDEDDEEDDEPKKPAKKAKDVEKPAKKSAPAKEEKKQTEKKAEKKTEKKATAKRGVKLDPKNNKDDRREFKFLEKFFPTDKYEYCWIAMNGVTIKYKGKNSSRAVLSMETCSKQADGSITCNLYLLTFTKSLEVLDEANMEYGICWNGAPFMRGIKFTEVEDVVKKLLEHMEEFVGKIDKRLGDNRKKMEDSLKKTTKKDKAAKKSKVEEPEDEDEEDDEDEDEDEKPSKKAKSEKPAKKSEPEPEDEDDEDEDEEDEDDEPKKPAKKGKK